MRKIVFLVNLINMVYFEFILSILILIEINKLIKLSYVLNGNLIYVVYLMINEEALIVLWNLRLNCELKWDFVLN